MRCYWCKINKKRNEHLTMELARWTEDSRTGKMAERKPPYGSRFDDRLKEERVFEVQARALKLSLIHI